jgi:hypothetical protein
MKDQYVLNQMNKFLAFQIFQWALYLSVNNLLSVKVLSGIRIDNPAVLSQLLEASIDSRALRGEVEM